MFKEIIEFFGLGSSLEEPKYNHEKAQEAVKNLPPVLKEGLPPSPLMEEKDRLSDEEWIAFLI